ncbi:MAG: GGDEF domain-containing protein [Nannocystaceae bacterium]|nr:GGDEF domain-containing protein [Nannocystaceae bacterium]
MALATANDLTTLPPRAHAPADGFAFVRLMHFLATADSADAVLHRAVAGLGLLPEVRWAELDGGIVGDVHLHLDDGTGGSHRLEVGVDSSRNPAAVAYVEHVLAIAASIYAREQEVARLREEAATDPLTGLWNRRGFEPQLDQALARAARTGEAIALVAIDLDRFKPINDELGHDAGDRALQAVATAIEGAIRPSDVAVRLGGDEFAVLLTGADAQGAKLVCERIRRSLARVNPLAPRALSLSFGVADLSALRHPGIGPAGRGELLAAADAALYEAKAAGRDAVVCCGDVEGAIEDEHTRPILVRAS